MVEDILRLDISTATRLLLKAIRKTTGRWVTKGVVTLDADSTTIRLLETTGGKVKKWASIPLEAGEVEEGAVSEPPDLGTLVKQLMSSSDIKAKKVNVSLSGLYSISRILPMSNLPGGLTTEEAVLEMAKEVMPLSEDRLYLSWQTVTAGEGEQNALVVGVPREMIDSEVQSLRAAGINPSVLELKAMALTRVVKKEQAIILNIELASFDIIVAVNGVPEIMRTLPWQQDKLTEEGKAEHLALNLGLTVDFYNLRHPGAHLDPATPLFITGQMSEDATLGEKLQARLGYPIEPLVPPLECPENLPISQYAVNIGLALRETVSSENLGEGSYSPLDINLLPQAYRPWKPSANQIYLFGALIAIIAMLLPLYQITTDTIGKTATLETKHTTLNNELERRKVEIANREPLQKAIVEYHTIVDMGGGFTEDLGVIRDEADKLGVQVESISHAGKSITIACQADSYVTFRKYLTALEESGRFSSPIPPPEGYPYTKSGTIKAEPVTGESETGE